MFRASILSILLSTFLFLPLRGEPPLSFDQDFEARVGEVIPIPVRDADQNTQFDVWPQTTRWYPTQKWGSQECVILFFPNRPGQFAFFVAKPGSESTVSLERIVVTVSGPEPPQPPTPPEPTPDLTGLAKLAYDHAQQVSPAGRTFAKELAEAYLGVAASIAAGALKEPRSILEATATATSAALGNQVEAWKDWDDKMAEELGRVRPRTPEQFRIAWEEIATGLASVANSESR